MVFWLFQPSLSVGATSTSGPAPLAGDTARDVTTNQPTVSAATAAAALQMMTQAMAAGMAGTATGDYTSQTNPSLDPSNPEIDPPSSLPPQRNHSTPLFENQAESSTSDSNTPTFSHHPSRFVRFYFPSLTFKSTF